MVRRVLLLLSLASAPQAAEAGSPPECLSPATKFNVCDAAKRMHAEFSAALPMPLNANITLTTAVVAGPRIVITALWRITKVSLDASMAAGQMTIADLESKTLAFTQNSICSQDVTAAFIRLGGQIQYLYKIEDGSILVSPLITACPNKTKSP